MVKFKVLSGIEGLNSRRSRGHDRQPEVSRTSTHTLHVITSSWSRRRRQNARCEVVARASTNFLKMNSAEKSKGGKCLFSSL